THAHIEHGKDGERSGKESAGKGAEKRSCVRCDRGNDRAACERHHHDAARYTLYRPLKLHPWKVPHEAARCTVLLPIHRSNLVVYDAGHDELNLTIRLPEWNIPARVKEFHT